MDMARIVTVSTLWLPPQNAVGKSVSLTPLMMFTTIRIFRIHDIDHFAGIFAVGVIDAVSYTFV